MKFFTQKNILRIVLFSAGLLFAFYVIGSFNWGAIGEHLRKVNYFEFFLASALTLAAYFFFRTLRWRLLLKDENIEIPFGKLYLYNTISIGISTVTPFQAGEGIKVELLKKYGGKRLSGYTIFFLERVLDLITVSSLAIIGVLLGMDFGIGFDKTYTVAFLAAAISIAVIGCFFLMRLKIFQPVNDFLANFKNKKNHIYLAFGLTIVSWATIVLGWKLALSFFDIYIGYLQAAALVAITTLIAVLSLIPGAVGVSEISVSTLLAGMGIETDAAQAGAIAIRAYALVILVLTLLHWLYFKFAYGRPKK